MMCLLNVKKIILDEKLVIYNTVKCKVLWSKKDELAQSTSKAIVHQKTVRLISLVGLERNRFFQACTVQHNDSLIHKLNDSLTQKRPELINREGVL